MIRPILKKGDPRLNCPTKKVTIAQDVNHVIADLWDTLFAIKKLHGFERGLGVAAPQIGYNWRITAVTFDEHRYTLINPIIVHRSAAVQLVREGCLSFFNYRGYTHRYNAIVVRAIDILGHPFALDAKGEFSMLLQHELDHLDGIMYDMHLLPSQQLIHRPEMPKIP